MPSKLKLSSRAGLYEDLFISCQEYSKGKVELTTETTEDYYRVFASNSNRKGIPIEVFCFLCEKHSVEGFNLKRIKDAIESAYRQKNNAGTWLKKNEKVNDPYNELHAPEKRIPEVESISGNKIMEEIGNLDSKITSVLGEIHELLPYFVFNQDFEIHTLKFFVKMQNEMNMDELLKVGSAMGLDDETTDLIIDKLQQFDLLIFNETSETYSRSI